MKCRGDEGENELLLGEQIFVLLDLVTLQGGVFLQFVFVRLRERRSCSASEGVICTDLNVTLQ